MLELLNLYPARLLLAAGWSGSPHSTPCSVGDSFLPQLAFSLERQTVYLKPKYFPLRIRQDSRDRKTAGNVLRDLLKWLFLPQNRHKYITRAEYSILHLTKAPPRPPPTKPSANMPNSLLRTCCHIHAAEAILLETDHVQRPSDEHRSPQNGDLLPSYPSTVLSKATDSMCHFQTIKVCKKKTIHFPAIFCWLSRALS